MLCNNDHAGTTEHPVRIERSTDPKVLLQESLGMVVNPYNPVATHANT